MTPARTTQPNDLSHPPAGMGGVLQRYFQGLKQTDLLDDVLTAPHTLLAPIDDAFDALPWRFSDLLESRDLFEERFDLFEYLVVRGVHGAHGPAAPIVTLEGSAVAIGHGLVVGTSGTARVLHSFIWNRTLVHMLDRCIFPRVMSGRGIRVT